MKACQPQTRANSFLWVRFLAEDCLESSCESFMILITVLETFQLPLFHMCNTELWLSSSRKSYYCVPEKAAIVQLFKACTFTCFGQWVEKFHGFCPTSIPASKG
ncbi:hypothetical protein AVEN_1497-1 [Araneus ventricosus]|uniref:Uncharacterized protein n=1 Tax=Araneus ventricosus TaxID=182803 RepID=A0A4Y2MHR9_ARAVE|nr:hypothetical protein AVEN_1497-1 [Araneus ventricosus]